MNRIMKVVGSLVCITLAVSGGYLYGRRGTTPPPAKTQTPAGEYTCPMHPFITKDKPGACAICGMELVKKNSGTGLADKDLKNISHVALSPTQQIMANLATVAATQKPFNREITCTGSVTFNQERQGKVSAWVAGRIDKLLVTSVGSEVRKERPVAELFSIDLYNAQVQYLVAYKTLKILNSSASVTFPINTQMSLGETYERLRQLGFRQEQFDKLHKVATPTVMVPIYSPFSGIVTEKLVKEGQYVNIGDPLFAIADLSRIWVELEIFENDFSAVKIGQEVTIHAQAYPRETFRGRVKLIYPFLDPKTRTIKLRVEIPNPGLKLKPEMFVQASIHVPQTASLVIPATAVIDTGTRQVVWVESGPGVFLQRDVSTGARSGTEVQILSGLKAGEKVAITGGYLIDSEAQLSHTGEVRDKSAGMPPKPAPRPASKDELDMKEMKMN